MIDNTESILETKKNDVQYIRKKTINNKNLPRITCLIRKYIGSICDLLTHSEIWKDEDKENFSWNDFYELAGGKVEFVAKNLGLNQEQVLILCYLTSQHYDVYVSEIELARNLNCNMIEFMEYQADIESLKKQRFIYTKKDGMSTGYLYRVVPAFIEALRKGEKFKPEIPKFKKTEDLFSAAYDVFTERGADWFDYDSFISELRLLVKKNKHLNFSAEIIKMKLSDENFMIVFYFCLELFIFERVNIYLAPMDEFAEKNTSFKFTEALFDNDEHELIKLKIIEKYHEHDILDFQSDEPKYRLTAKAADDLLSELPLIRKSSIKSGYIKKLKNETAEKKLFFNEAEEEQIRRLEFILGENKFSSVLKRLKEKDMPCGVTCFFHGSPGTGKTETAFNLARKTGREIIQVDLSTIKDAYVGESEKNVKAMFDQYRELYQKSAAAPILLINEADGIFTGRVMINKDSKNSTVAQMQNTMQNIMLNELDIFEGILIATTNLSYNMDQAFERRFLYKIEFKKPNSNVRKKIWLSLLPELPEEIVNTLAEKYNFSGGEIYNIARKCNINYVVLGIETDYDSLEKLCEKEKRGFYAKETVIGF